MTTAICPCLYNIELFLANGPQFFFLFLIKFAFGLYEPVVVINTNFSFVNFIYTRYLILFDSYDDI